MRLMEKPNDWLLEVRNTGDSPRPDFNPDKHHDLGLQIIQGLVRGDLQGQFTLIRDGEETIASIRWPKT